MGGGALVAATGRPGGRAAGWKEAVEMAVGFMPGGSGGGRIMPGGMGGYSTG